MPPQPRRRPSNPERRQWPDERLNDLAEDVADHANQLDALRLLPGRVADIRQSVDELRASIRDNSAQANQRITGVNEHVLRVADNVNEARRETEAELKQFRRDMKQRFDTVDGAHETMSTRAGKLDWKTILMISGTCVIPIVVALIALAAAR